MSAAAPVVAGGRAALADDPAVLARIRDGDVELAVWRREPPPVLAWLAGLDRDGIDDLDLPVEVRALEADIAAALAEAGYPGNAHGRALRNEIVALSRLFAATMGCGTVRLRLEIVETDACRKFHSDYVTARLLMTLVGPATQWIEAADPARIQALAPGDVAIFKGRRWVGEPSILHRSPPIAGTGDTRLLLAIDPL